MDWVRLLSGTATPRTIFFCLLIVCSLLSSGSAVAAWTAPVTGSGNFPISVDVVNRWRDDDRVDVLILVAVANRDLSYEVAADRARGAVRLEVVLQGPGGEQVDEKRNFRTELMTMEDSLSPTLFQVFGLILEDVPFQFGRLVCRVVDVKQVREGLINQMKKKKAMSEAVADWYAPSGPRPEEAVGVGDPFFLAHAPLRTWNPNQEAANSIGTGFLQDYMHPARRYGLEQDRLQVFLPIWPVADPAGRQDLPDGLRVQVTSLDMQFTVEDTIDFDERGLQILEAGRPAGVAYELDVNLLPEGSYRMAIAPLGGKGQGVLTGFDVTWSLTGIGRHRDRISGEGATVFSGAALREFKSASLPEQEKLLNEFWDKLNTDPESPVNEVYLEFQYRIAYAERFLGGFGPNGAMDPRGEVFIMLGPPDHIERNAMPANELDLEDAMVKVYDKSAPDREGNWAKGSNPSTGPQSQLPWWTEGGIPMPYSYYAERDIFRTQGTASMHFGYELWRYKQGGRSLFVNLYSTSKLGKRFLFLDRSGSGRYELRSTNIMHGNN